MELVDVRRIWDQAPHNAFTDLIRFKDEWLCVFREGEGHVSPDGALRVIASSDGQDWEGVGLVEDADADLRDAKITITPAGGLLLSGAAKPRQGPFQSYSWFSPDGRQWSPGVAVGEEEMWLWRVTWFAGVAYGVGYSTDEAHLARLYRSDDGRAFSVLAPEMFSRRLHGKGYPNETSLVFLADGTGLCLLRRDDDTGSAQLGRAQPPYTQWDWLDLGLYFGGPHMLRLPDGRFVAAGRVRAGEERSTRLCWLDVAAGRLDEALVLPSGGDTSYAGLVWHDGLLWVSYYSSHEEKTAIYLARVRLD